MRLPSWTKPRVVPAPTEPTPRPSPRRTPQRANSDSALLPIAQSPAGHATASPARATPLPSPGTPNDLECEELHLDRDQRSSSKPRFFFRGAAFAPAAPTNGSPGARVRSGMVAAGYRLEMPAPNARRARRREAPEETTGPEDATASARRDEFRARWQRPDRRGFLLAAPPSEAAAKGSGPTRPRPGRSASEPCLLPSRHREEDAVPTDATEDDVEAEPPARHQRNGAFFVAAAAAVVAAIR